MWSMHLSEVCSDGVQGVLQAPRTLVKYVLALEIGLAGDPGSLNRSSSLALEEVGPSLLTFSDQLL